MVKIWEVYPEARFLTAADITDGTEVVITGYEIQKDNKVVLRFAGLEKTLPVNAGNAHRIKAAYGDGADNWIGKKIVLYPDMVKLPQGGMKAGVCVRVPRRAGKPGQASRGKSR